VATVIGMSDRRLGITKITLSFRMTVKRLVLCLGSLMSFQISRRVLVQPSCRLLPHIPWLSGAAVAQRKEPVSTHARTVRHRCQATLLGRKSELAVPVPPSIGSIRQHHTQCCSLQPILQRCSLPPDLSIHRDIDARPREIEATPLDQGAIEAERLGFHR
jgi:hypothetical protein